MRWVKLEECCTIQGGATPKRNVDSFWGEGLDWFTPKDLSSLNTKEIGRAPEQVTDEGLNSCSAKLIPANSLLLSSRAPIGHLAITIKDCCTNQGFQSLIPKQGAVDVEYLYFVMKWSVPRLQDMGRGATFKEISKAIVKGFEIPLPPLEEQKRIAGILDEADRVRKKTQALIDKYDELAQSLFLDMFGDPVTNPKGWEVKPLQDLLVQKPDNGFFAKKDKYGPEGVPVVWLSDFIDRTYVSQKELKRAQVEPKDKKYELEYGDALFCRSSLTVEGIGKCSIVPKTMDEPTIFECHIIRLKLNLGELVPEYLRFLTDTTFFRQQVMRNAKTSTMTTIAQDGISQIAIPLPPSSVQEDFCRRVTLMQHQKQLVEDAIDEGHLVFNALLHKAFKGELN